MVTGLRSRNSPNSTQFVVGSDGLEHRTAWAGAGDGVLFIDADGSGSISNLSEYVFTEWDASAGNDLEALRRAFDSNGDGKLTSADARCRAAIRRLSAHSYLYSTRIMSLGTLCSNPRRTESHNPPGNPVGISATAASKARSALVLMSSNT